ncbi:DDE-type integrase/transposase/recombinase [Ferrovibrio terrae]|uniref:Mu transposase C-terminal domain-containing protein n=1 Tax=Ferrovibrio terrae TaxID=2594003 RepID=UPI003137BDC9
MYRIPAGQSVYVDGIHYRMHVITTEGGYVLENQVTRAPIILSNDDFSARLADGTVTLDSPPQKDTGFDPVQADFFYLSKPLKAETTKRHQYVEAMRGLSVPRTAARLKIALSQIAAKLGDPQPPSARTVIRWMSRWEQAGARDIRVLVPNVHRRGNRRRRVDSDVLDLIEIVIEEHYCRPEDTTAISVHELVCGKLKAHNDTHQPAEHLPYPSLATIRRAIADRMPYEVMVARKGKLAANMKFIPVQPAPKATKPLEVIEIDHTILDIMLVDEETRQVIGRPTMTAAIDKYSRMIVGFYVGFEPPGTHTVMLCLKHAILNKQYVQDRYPDIKNKWPCQGVPTSIMVDNGLEFHSEGFREACAQLGINLSHAPGRSPWYKSAIERFFGVHNTSLLHQIPGTTFSGPKQRGDYKSEKAACLSLLDLQHIIHIWLIDHYSQRIPRLRGKSPIEVWTHGVAMHGITPLRSANDLNSLVGGFARRRITRKGISLFDLYYCSDAVFDLLNRPHAPKLVEIRYNHDDLSYILVQDPLTKQFIKLPSTEPEYTTGLSLALHKLSKREAGKRTAGSMTVADLGVARQHIKAEIDKSLTRTASLRRKTAVQIKRLQSSDADSSSTEILRAPIIPPAPSNDQAQSAEQQRPSRSWVSIETEE